MITIRFGDFRIDDSDPNWTGNLILGQLPDDNVELVQRSSSSFTLTHLVTGAEITYSGRFSYSSQQAFLNSRLTGFTITDGDDELVLSISGVRGLTFRSAITNINSLNALERQGVDALGSRFDDRFEGGRAADSLEGAAGNDTIYALGGNDHLLGDAGDDTLDGGVGNDTLDGGDGADVLIGGLGNDLFLVGAGDSVADVGGRDEVRTGLAAYTLPDGIENLVLLGDLAGQAGSGNGLANIIRGGDGGSILSGLGGNDRLFGGAGADVLDGGAGNDMMTGAAGDDTYLVDSVRDRLTERAGGGTDTVVSTLAGYTLPNNVENLTLGGAEDISGRGNALANVLTGNAGDNTLDGRAGDDLLIGGDGDDRYVVDAGDTVQEAVGEGTDTVFSALSRTLEDNVENLVLTGRRAVSGTGNELDNALTGNGGSNTLDGGLGDDILDGGGGRDMLIGGEGEDRFVYDPRDSLVDGGAGEDTLLITRGRFTLDLTRIPDDRITGIDVIDLTGTGNNTLRFTADDVLALTDAGTLRVDGAPGDRVISAGWALDGDPVDIGGVFYQGYTNGAATLLVDTAITDVSLS